MNFIDLGKISIVDDDESIRRATRALLRSVGYEVETFASAELFLESEALRETDCLVLDVRIPGIDGFAVADNGLGVAPENHRKMFVPFQRLHDSTSSGTGIGLAICQRVVERYGGRIWVDSQIRHGAPFRFTLPNIEVHSRKPALSEQSRPWKVRIVLVHDNAADVSLLRLALDDAEVNCELTVIDVGAEALAFVRQQGQ